MTLDSRGIEGKTFWAQGVVVNVATLYLSEVANKSNILKSGYIDQYFEGSSLSTGITKRINLLSEMKK